MTETENQSVSTDGFDAYSLTGVPIAGTLDYVPGVARVSEGTWRRDGGGSLNFDWAGYTDMLWDDQTTLRDAPEHAGISGLAMRPQGWTGQRLFIDDDGDLWRESEIVLVPAGEPFDPSNRD